MHRLLLHRKTVSYAAGNHLFALHRESLPPGSAHFYAEAGKRGQGKRLYEVKGNYVFDQAKAEVIFRNVSIGERMKLYTRGGSYNRDSTIKHPNGLVAAKIDRRWFLVRREYTATILPGVDNDADSG
jgi:hypothetical protein